MLSDISASDVHSLHKRVKDAFQAFDYEMNNTVDVREITTIIYSLGCFPSQKDIHEFIAELEEDHTGSVHLDKFLPVMTNVLMEHKFPSIPEDVLIQAFEVLDKDSKGYLDSEEMVELMTKEGESFTQDEMTEMLMALADHERRIYYKDIICQLTFDQEI
uniref:EF-hand calcium binding domain 2 n=1 Tax=Cynoglossus semilaevis TaxID=244447 RepID=A0A3P8UJI6_CYNSE